MSDQLYDVVEVGIMDERVVQVMAQNKTEDNAEAVVMFAVMRRGAEHSFFTVVSAGSYAAGDAWMGAR